MRTQSTLSMYWDKKVRVDVRTIELDDHEVREFTIVVRPDTIVILPLRHTETGQLEVMLCEQPRPAVDNPRATEAITETLEPDQHDPYLATNRVLGANNGPQADGMRMPQFTIHVSPDYTTQRWHLIAGHGMPAVEAHAANPHPGSRWLTLDQAITEIDHGLIQDAKTMLALLLLHRQINTVDRVDRVGASPGQHR